MDRPIGVVVVANDLTGRVDSPSVSEYRAGEVEKLEIIVGLEKPMDRPAGIGVGAHNLTTSIDVFRLGRSRAGNRHIKTAALLLRTHEAVLQRRGNRWVPAPDEVSTGIDTEQVSVSCAREVELREIPALPEESVNNQDVAAGVQEVPLAHDCTRIVDPARVGVVGAREMDRGQVAALVEQKAMREPSIVDVGADHIDLTALA